MSDEILVVLILVAALILCGISIIKQAYKYPLG